MAGTLETLLLRIRDSVASAEEIEQARTLAQDDARLPAELQQIALTDLDDLEGDAAGLLSVLGADNLFGSLLRAAVDAEATPASEVVPVTDEVVDGWEPIAEVLVEGLRAAAVGIEVTDAVMRRVAGRDWVWGPPLRDAVAAEAGGVDVAGEVLASVEDGTPLGVLVAEAVRAEGGSIDVAVAVCRTLELADMAPVADAVRAEAGTVDVSIAVMAGLEGSALVPVADAVRHEGGTTDVATQVAGALGHEVLPVAEAVRAEAGTVDVVAEVLGAIAATEQDAEVVAMPLRVEQPAPVASTVAANNNRGWTWGGLALAAVALIIVGGSQLFGATTPTLPDAQPLLFASADEVVVEELDYGSDVTVFQAEGDEGAVIIWVDEEA